MASAKLFVVFSSRFFNKKTTSNLSAFGTEYALEMVPPASLLLKEFTCICVMIYQMSTHQMRHSIKACNTHRLIIHSFVFIYAIKGI